MNRRGVTSGVFGTIWILLSVLIVSGPVSAASPGLSYQRVVTDGVGTSFDEALRNALVQAVGQVNGTEVAQKVSTTKVIGSYHEKSVSSGVAVANEVTQSQAVGAAVVSGTDNQGQHRTEGVAAAVATIEASQTVATGAASVTTQIDFVADKKVISASEDTSGIISRYQVLSYKHPSNEWTVSVLAEIAVYRSSETSKRLKVAVPPFRLASQSPLETEFEQQLRMGIVNQLTQSGKLAVLDRDFSTEDQGELDFLREGGVKKDEMAKLGNKLGADYILVGVISRVRSATDTHKIRAIDKTIRGATWVTANISYRLIETATGVAEFADSLASKDKRANSVEALATRYGDIVSAEIVQALFPIRIEHIANGVFYFGQGGTTVREGQRYRLIKQGEAIVDSYTHEVLGREQTDIAELEVIEVQPRFAKAKLVGKPIEISDTSGLIVLSLKKKEADNTAGEGAALAISAPKKPAKNVAKQLLNKEEDSW